MDLTHQSKMGLGSDMMPIQLGLISGYCLKECGAEVAFEIIKFTNELTSIFNKQPPFIVAASNYLWNINLSYQAMSLIKEKYPHTITVLGGPNYPDDYPEQVDFMKQYPNIDFFIYKDGEVPFTNLVKHLLSNPDVRVAKKSED